MPALLHAYGMAIAADVTLPGERPGTGTPDVTVRFTGALSLDGAFSGLREPDARVIRRVDGRDVLYEGGRNGDVGIVWDGAGAFHISPDGATVLAYGPEGATPTWTRFLLDSVLATTALARGDEALHAGAFVADGGAIAVAAGEGGGKSTLLATAAGAGHPVLADDVLIVRAAADQVTAHPAPPVMNLARSAPPGVPPPEDLGRVLADLGGEAWTLLAEPAREALPLRAFVILERRPGAETEIRRLIASPVAVLGALMESGRAPTRQVSRLDIASAVARHAVLLHLQADPGVPPETLLTRLLRAVRHDPA